MDIGGRQDRQEVNIMSFKREKTLSSVKSGGRTERGTQPERPEGPTTAGLAASNLETPKFSLMKNGPNNSTALCVLKGKVEVIHLKTPGHRTGAIAQQ